MAADVLARDIRRAAGSVGGTERVLLGRCPGSPSDDDVLLCLQGLSNRTGSEGCGGSSGPLDREYRLSKDPRPGEGYELMQRQQCPGESFGAWQPVEAGIAQDGLRVDEVYRNNGEVVSVRVSFCLIQQDGEVTPCGSYEGDSRWLRFHVVNRTAAVTI